MCKKGRLGRDSQLHPDGGMVVGYAIYMTSMGEEIETSMYLVAHFSRGIRAFPRRLSKGDRL